jgi:hypothetical protein
MVDDPHQFSALINAIGKTCDDKDVDMVIVALAISIANVGISQEIPYETFLQKVLKVITSVYVIDEMNIEDDGSIH